MPTNFRNIASAKYLFIVATEAAIDICNHIVARRGRRSPESYADCFEVLADMGVIEADLATPLKAMARFRNLVVHLYWKVDNRKIYQPIQNDLGDLDLFRQQVKTWLPL